VYSVHDWAEVHRLHHVEGMGKAAIAAKLGMSRTTVHRLLGRSEPPRYERRRAGSKLDPFCDAIAAMLREDPKVPATVIAGRLRREGFTGSLTILKDHLRRVRPALWPRRPTSAPATCPASSPRSTGGIPAWPSRSARVGLGRRSVWWRPCPRRRRCGWCSPWPGPRPSTARPCWVALSAWVGYRRRWSATTTPGSSPAARVGWSAWSPRWPRCMGAGPASGRPATPLPPGQGRRGTLDRLPGDLVSAAAGTG
jgi:hypothetical protein